MSAKGYWFAFGLGVTAGAAVSLLYAPQSGVRTRKQLRQGMEDSAEYLEDAAADLKKQAAILSKEAQKIIARTKSQLDDAVDTASGAVTGAVKSVQSLM